MAETEAVFVYTAWPSPGTAEAAGAALVEARLAAAVNIFPGVNSIYRWRGAVERARKRSWSSRPAVAASTR
jgi:periplasmic divalent cation tolerance protein